MGRAENDKPSDLLPGTLEMLILKALKRGPLHGYGVAEWILDASDEALKIEEGALYPALHRLEVKGYLSSEWGESENNRRAKYYRMTRAGQKQLQWESERWDRISSVIGQVMRTA
jgi:PadR family transcriptional regulator PadR